MVRDRQRATSDGAYFVRDDFAVVELATGDDHVGTVFREREDHFATEPAAASGDDRDLAGEVEELCVHVRMLSQRANARRAACRPG